MSYEKMRHGGKDKERPVQAPWFKTEHENNYWDLFAGIKSLQGRSKRLRRSPLKSSNSPLSIYLCSLCCLFSINQTTYHFRQACRDYSRSFAWRGANPCHWTAIPRSTPEHHWEGRRGHGLCVCLSCTASMKLAGFSRASSFRSRWRG